MSIYSLIPLPPEKENCCAFWEKGFSDEEIARIRDIGEPLATHEGTVGDRGAVADIRRSKIGWLPYNEQTGWLYDRLGYIARRLNGQFFDFDLTGFVEDLQYTVYGSDRGHYDWHVDRGVTSEAPRKLSMVLQLSDPAEYDGGDLELWDGGSVIAARREKGILYAFPSFVVHRVTPVTRGVRRSLVVWLVGPRFR